MVNRRFTAYDAEENHKIKIDIIGTCKNMDITFQIGTEGNLTLSFDSEVAISIKNFLNQIYKEK